MDFQDNSIDINEQVEQENQVVEEKWEDQQDKQENESLGETEEKNDGIAREQFSLHSDSKQLPSGNNPNLQCGECKKMYSTASVLKKHKRSIHEGILFPCRFCDKKMTQLSHLKIHVTRVHAQENH